MKSASYPISTGLLLVTCLALALEYAAMADSRDGARVTANEGVVNAKQDGLKRAAAKLTYFGEQTKPILTVVLKTERTPVSTDLFIDIQANGRKYGNDALPRVEVRISAAEFERLLAAVKPVITRKGGGGGREYLSFAVIRKSDGKWEGYEFLLGPNSAKDFYEKLIGALDRKNQAGREALRQQSVNVIGRKEKGKKRVPCSNGVNRNLRTVYATARDGFKNEHRG